MKVFLSCDTGGSHSILFAASVTKGNISITTFSSQCTFQGTITCLQVSERKFP